MSSYINSMYRAGASKKDKKFAVPFPLVSLYIRLFIALYFQAYAEILRGDYVLHENRLVSK